jgi:hypothetical protein
MTNAAKSIISPPIAHPEVRNFAEAKVNLPQDAVQARRDKINELRDRLARWMKEHPDCGIAKSYHSGSLAKGTALRVSSDADLALYIRHNGPRRANRELSEWIAERLRKAYPQMAPEQIQPEEFSVKIIFKTAGIDVDVVPVFYASTGVTAPPPRCRPVSAGRRCAWLARWPTSASHLVSSRMTEPNCSSQRSTSRL